MLHFFKYIVRRLGQPSNQDAEEEILNESIPDHKRLRERIRATQAKRNTIEKLWERYEVTCLISSIVIAFLGGLFVAILLF